MTAMASSSLQTGFDNCSEMQLKTDHKSGNLRKTIPIFSLKAPRLEITFRKKSFTLSLQVNSLKLTCEWYNINVTI